MWRPDETPPEELAEQLHQQVVTILWFSFFLYKGSPQKKTLLFGPIDPDVGGLGRVVPNFYKSLFLWHI